jgi:hypothetical protein
VNPRVSIRGKPSTILARATDHIDIALFEQAIKSQYVIAWYPKAIRDPIIHQTIDQVLTNRLVGIPSLK